MLDIGMPMTFFEYEQLIKQTAIYPNIGNNIYYPALGLSGEAGEVAEKVKKLMRDADGQMSDEFREELAKELGDVLWYVCALCSEIDISLEEVAERNREKLIDRLDRNVLKGSGDNR